MFEFFKAKLDKKKGKQTEDKGNQMFSECVEELTYNKELFEYGDQSDGCSSDSCPSEDNLDDNDMAKLMPISKEDKQNQNDDQN